MDPKKVVDISSDDEDDDYKVLTKLLDIDDDNDGDDVNTKNDDEVIMVVNENAKKNVVKNLKVKLKVKLVDDIKDIDDDDDECVILENDPNEKLEVKDDGGNKTKKGGVNEDEDDEIVVVSEKGQVACRDYPHSRHLCIKFPFSTTPNQNHCKQCYCYVCDSLAPCVYWGNGSANSDHCHATDKDDIWRIARERVRKINKGAQPVKRHHPVDPGSLAPAMVQPQNFATRARMIHGPHASPNFRPPPNIHNQNRSHVLSSRHNVHPDLVSQFVLKHHRSPNLGTRVQKRVIKKTAPVAITNRTSYGPYSGPHGDSSRQQYQHSYQYQNYVNGMLSRPNKYAIPSQPNPVNTSGLNPPRNQSYTSSTVNRPPPPPQPTQFSKQSNPNFQPQVNTNPFPGNPFYSPNMVTPSFSIPVQSGYVDPVQSSYSVPFSQVDSLSVSVSDYIQNSAQGTQTQAHSPLANSSFHDFELKLPSNQDSITTPEGAVPTSEPTYANLCDSLTADYAYDWIFNDQPVESGLLDIPPGPNGVNDFSSDSTYIDTGPIFDF